MGEVPSSQSGGCSKSVGGRTADEPMLPETRCAPAYTSVKVSAATMCPTRTKTACVSVRLLLKATHVRYHAVNYGSVVQNAIDGVG